MDKTRDEAERTYYQALKLVREIDGILDAGRHLRDVTGKLIVTLDQAIIAIEQNRLAPLGVQG